MITTSKCDCERDIALSIKLLIKESYKVFRDNVKIIVGLLFMIYLPVAALSFFADMKLNNIDKVNELLIALKDTALSPDAIELNTALLSDAMAKQQLYMIVSLVITLISSVFLIAVIKMAADSSEGAILSEDDFENESIVVDVDEERDTQYYFSEAVKALPRYIFVALLSVVFVIGGLLLFVLPGLVSIVISFFIVHVVALTPFKGRVAFAFSRTVIAKKPKLLAIYAVTFILQFVFADIVSAGVALIPIGNAYAEFAMAVLSSCFIQFFVTFLDIMLAVAFSYTIRKTPELKQIIEAGEEYEAKKSAQKNND